MKITPTEYGPLDRIPPVLASESPQDLAVLVQGLAEQYQPLGLLEQSLIQQIAICMLRARRAMVAEVVAGDRAMAERELASDYPAKEDLSAAWDTDRRAATHPAVLQAERAALAPLRDVLTYAWEDAPEEDEAFKAWCGQADPDTPDDPTTNHEWACHEISTEARECCKCYPNQARPKDGQNDHVLVRVAWLAAWEDAPGNLAVFHRQHSREIREAIDQRISDIDNAMARIEQLKGLAKRSQPITAELETIGRYEQRNQNLMRQCLEHLVFLQASRQQVTPARMKARPLRAICGG